MRKCLVIGLLIVATSGTANATDCVSWRKIPDEARQARVDGMITSHVNSNVSKRYTSENRVAILGCLRQFAAQISDEFDAACDERPGGSAEYLDDIFDRYLLSCIR